MRMEQRPTAETNAASVEELREHLNAIQLRVLDVLGSVVKRRIRLRLAIAVTIAALAVVGVGLYYNIATHRQNNNLAHIAKLDYRVNLDFNNAILCLSMPAPEQKACEAQREAKLVRDQDALERALG